MPSNVTLPDSSTTFFSSSSPLMICLSNACMRIMNWFIVNFILFLLQLEAVFEQVGDRLLAVIDSERSEDDGMILQIEWDNLAVVVRRNATQHSKYLDLLVFPIHPLP